MFRRQKSSSSSSSSGRRRRRRRRRILLVLSRRRSRSRSRSSRTKVYSKYSSLFFDWWSLSLSSLFLLFFFETPLHHMYVRVLSLFFFYFLSTPDSHQRVEQKREHKQKNDLKKRERETLNRRWTTQKY